MNFNDWIAVVALVSPAFITILVFMWRIASLLATIATTLKTHGRRIDVLEAGATGGRNAAIKRRHDIDFEQT